MQWLWNVMQCNAILAKYITKFVHCLTLYCPPPPTPSYLCAKEPNLLAAALSAPIAHRSPPAALSILRVTSPRLPLPSAGIPAAQVSSGSGAAGCKGEFSSQADSLDMFLVAANNFILHTVR